MIAAISSSPATKKQLQIARYLDVRTYQEGGEPARHPITLITAKNPNSSKEGYYWNLALASDSAMGITPSELHKFLEKAGVRRGTYHFECTLSPEYGDIDGLRPYQLRINKEQAAKIDASVQRVLGEEGQEARRPDRERSR